MCLLPNTVATSQPGKQCYCKPGYMGLDCSKDSVLKEADRTGLDLANYEVGRRKTYRKKTCSKRFFKGCQGRRRRVLLAPGGGGGVHAGGGHRGEEHAELGRRRWVK